LIRKMGEEIDAVMIDNYNSAFKGVSYLIRMGHRKIAIVNGDDKLILYQQRFQGYIHALKDAGIAFDPSLVLSVSNEDSCYETVSSFLQRGKDIDAFFAASDLLALEVMRAAQDAGFSIPEDISVLGFDDLPFSPFLNPPLTTVHQPLYQMGQNAAERLISIIEGEQSKPIVQVLETKLIERKSVLRRCHE
jgi:LacI family transcriptional regulator